MENETLQAFLSVADSLSTISVLLFMIWLLRRDLERLREEKRLEQVRFENLMGIFVQDWQKSREEDRDMIDDLREATKSGKLTA